MARTEHKKAFCNHCGKVTWHQRFVDSSNSIFTFLALFSFLLFPVIFLLSLLTAKWDFDWLDKEPFYCTRCGEEEGAALTPEQEDVADHPLHSFGMLKDQIEKKP